MNRIGNIYLSPKIPDFSNFLIFLTQEVALREWNQGELTDVKTYIGWDPITSGWVLYE